MSIFLKKTEKQQGELYILLSSNKRGFVILVFIFLLLLFWKYMKFQYQKVDLDRWKFQTSNEQIIYSESDKEANQSYLYTVGVKEDEGYVTEVYVNILEKQFSHTNMMQYIYHDYNYVRIKDFEMQEFSWIPFNYNATVNYRNPEGADMNSTYWTKACFWSGIKVIKIKATFLGLGKIKAVDLKEQLSQGGDLLKIVLK